MLLRRVIERGRKGERARTGKEGKRLNLREGRGVLFKGLGLRCDEAEEEERELEEPGCASDMGESVEVQPSLSAAAS